MRYLIIVISLPFNVFATNSFLIESEEMLTKYGMRELPGNTDISPRFHCDGDSSLGL